MTPYITPPVVTFFDFTKVSPRVVTVQSTVDFQGGVIHGGVEGVIKGGALGHPRGWVITR